jgi:hypothetical protein
MNQNKAEGIICETYSNNSKGKCVCVFVYKYKFYHKIQILNEEFIDNMNIVFKVIE